MSDARSSAALRFGRTAAMLAAVGFVLAYFVVAALRIGYPFEIEWMEGGSLGHAARIASGEPLYAPPSLAFTAFIYTPLYFQIGAWLTPLLGDGFGPLRAVSWLASIGCFALIGAFVLRETRDRAAALLAVGVFAATYRISGAWFDIARVDSLFLFFTLAALYPLRFGRGWRAGGLAALLAACAFFTKQTTLPIFAVFGLIVVARRDARWLAFFGVFGALVALGSLALHLASDGWSSYYLFELPGQHHARWSKVGRFWGVEVLGRLPVVVASAVAFFALDRGAGRSDRRLFYACLAAGTLGASMASRIHSGGYLNVLMPGYAGLSILFGLGVAELSRPAIAQHRPWLPVLVFGACVLQFVGLRYDLRAQIPSERDRLAGERLVETIRGFDGEVLVPLHGYLPALAGKPRSGQWMAIADVLRGHDGELEQALELEIRDAILTQRFDAILVDDDSWYPQELASAYVLDRALFDDRSVFMTRTGDRKRPEKLYRPRRALTR